MYYKLLLINIITLIIFNLALVMHIQDSKMIDLMLETKGTLCPTLLKEKKYKYRPEYEFFKFMQLPT